MYPFRVLVHLPVGGAMLALFLIPSIFAFSIVACVYIYYPITTHWTCLVISFSFSLFCAGFIFFLSYTLSTVEL